MTRYWRYSQENMQKLFDEGRIIQTKPGTVPAYKRYLDEGHGTPLGSVWDDIGPVQGAAGERLGYPTQKPLKLLERILEISSQPNDIVLDAFCGCGTALVAAQNLSRQFDQFEAAMLRAKRNKGFLVGFDYSHDAMSEISSFFKREHVSIVPLTVREILDEEIAQKLT